MSTMYQNKTVINSPHLSVTHQLPSYKNTTSFASKQQRFTGTTKPGNMSPGPGTYEYSTTNYKLPGYHRETASQNQMVKREHQWIWGSSRGSYLNNLSASRAIGPGAYDLGHGFGVHQAVIGRTNWGKSERFIHKNQYKKGVKDVPGPGSYETKTMNYQHGLRSVFKSKSPRSFIQKLISQSSMPDLRKSQVQQFIQNPQVPYQLDKSSSNNVSSSNIGQKQSSIHSNKPHNNSVFASKIPRFASNATASETMVNLGPGSYDVPSSIQHQKSRSKLPKIITVRNQQKRRKKVTSMANKSQNDLPGPGAYNLNLKTIQNQLLTRGSVVICTQSRFSNKKQPKMPGPGTYLKNQSLARIQFQNGHKLQAEKPSFNSSSLRSPAELPTSTNPLCAYNLQYYDLQYKLKKNQEHIEKLRIMEVTVPAFNSKAKR